ncbi:hypothetical protein SOVF_010750 [Spinacia oleracea]|nr:hypothetical protein SOVF_010750 [Spinacia oleracea]
MSSVKSRAWIIVAAVEGIKDQGYAKWNHAIKSVNQHVKNNIRSYSQAKMLSGSSSSVISQNFRDDKLRESEESLKKVMYLNCWGPS